MTPPAQPPLQPMRRAEVRRRVLHDFAEAAAEVGVIVEAAVLGDFGKTAVGADAEAALEKSHSVDFMSSAKEPSSLRCAALK